MNVIDQIENHGITISLYDGKIKLEPVEKVTPAIVAEVKANKIQIIEVLRAKQTTPAITVQKMDVCLHGSRCRFISLVDDRQICGKNDQPIFDMSVCPDGRWWKAMAVDSVEATAVQPVACYACGGQTFWRKKDNIDGRWICEVCHPPVLSKDEIEWL